MFRRLLVIAAALLPTICSCAQDIEPGEWMELPEVSDASGLYALSMHMEGRTQRNYSFLWNEERLTADWVAYPLCKGNIGEGNRSNAFGLNPHMPMDMQPLLVRGYRNGNSGYYSRGHQIPSADRRAYRANVQTFYGTNMTPQDENLNGGIWGSLENKVRVWASRCDTLYVVSGCTYDGYDGEYALDNDGKRVAVPTGYYKALLMLTGDRWHTAAFRFENRPYGDGKYRQDMAIPLSELEAATGIVFFPRLKDVVGESLYKKIKSENPRSRQEWR